MEGLNRREFGMLAAAFGAFITGQEAHADVPVLSTQKVYRYSDLPVKKNEATGGEGRAVMDGKLPTGELLEVHETLLQPGQMPHPAHMHEHSELILILEGTVQFLNNGKAERPSGPDDILFCASNVPHGLKNVGSAPARYYVVAIGPKTESVYVDADGKPIPSKAK